jgi:hypothetical protein
MPVIGLVKEHQNGKGILNGDNGRKDKAQDVVG